MTAVAPIKPWRVSKTVRISRKYSQFRSQVNRGGVSVHVSHRFCDNRDRAEEMFAAACLAFDVRAVELCWFDLEADSWKSIRRVKLRSPRSYKHDENWADKRATGPRDLEGRFVAYKVKTHA